ncbi:type II toxin-antitoxin system RelE/ParE family toxin [Nocardiopsis valliformis]|uniref:type II toxin-antitoxin system RelE/ParE family toxin n=1 Tax=Nocardiopsis valliformis TaxID=239974 RepID=UPI00034A1907
MVVSWNVILLDEVHDWLLVLAKEDPRSADTVVAAIDMLAEVGPILGRLFVDVISHSRIHNLKELRPRTTGDTAIRVLFVFDPDRQAVLLVAGDKAGRWKQWYDRNIPLAELRYQRWLDGGYTEERG